MKADRDHIISLALLDNEKVVFEKQFSLPHPSLPDNQLMFPPFVIESIPEKMEPGVTFMSIRRRPPGRGH